MKKLILIILILITLLSSCTPEPSAKSDGLSVYRVLAGTNAGLYYVGHSGDRGLLRAESVAMLTSESELDAVLREIRAMPENPDVLPILSRGVTIISCEQTGREASVTLSDEFFALSEFEKTLLSACLTLSLCTVSGIETVSVYTDGEAKYLGLSGADMLLFDTETNPYERSIRLYYLSPGGRYLSPEYRALSVGRDAYLEEYAIEELLRGPGTADVSAAVPEGTRLLGISTDNGLCTANLSGEFMENIPKTIQGQRLAVLSVVNSLTSISGVAEVSILINGEPLTVYGEYAPAWPMQRSEPAIGPANRAKGEMDVSICVLDEAGKTVTLPRIIAPGEYSSREEAVAALMLSGETENGFSPVFANGGTYSAVVTLGGVCSIDLPAATLEKYNSGAGFSKMLSALRLALRETSGVNTLRVLKDGEYQETINN